MINNDKRMEYLFLRRRKGTSTSPRQKDLLYKAVEKQWKENFVSKGIEGREIDFEIYRSILYLLEIRQVFLDSALSLKKLSVMIETNQTYVSNVVNRYFGCNLKELLNSYRIEYAKELLGMGSCTLVEIQDFVASLLKVLFIQLSTNWREAHRCGISQDYNKAIKSFI